MKSKISRNLCHASMHTPSIGAICTVFGLCLYAASEGHLIFGSGLLASSEIYIQYVSEYSGVDCEVELVIAWSPVRTVA